jgi:transposase
MKRKGKEAPRRMLTVDDYEVIRRKVKIQGWSQREAARRLGHSRKTIRKALEQSVPPGYRRTQPIQRPVIEPVQGIIDAWLEEDQKQPRKQRHTAQRIYERLRDEYGFAGSASTVRRYVRQREATRGEVFFPLQFDPGEEAQVDWGEAWCVIQGEQRKVMLFCMRLCHSRAAFVRAYERQNQESLLDGHVRAFQYLGGVPRRLAYDNMKVAVITVGQGRHRRLTKRFKELRSHFLFESRFCNVAAGHEKGHVENLVKLAQRTFMTPQPDLSDLQTLNGHLLTECRRDLLRPVPRQVEQTRQQRLEEERRYLLALPEQPFEACKRACVFATKQALVRFDQNDYSVPVEYAHHSVLIKGFVERVELCVGSQRVAVHQRHYGSGEYILNPFHYLPLLERKPAGIYNARAFKGEPWGEDFTRMRLELEYRYAGEGTRKFVRLLLLFLEFPVAEVKAAVGLCLRRRAFSEEAVRAVLTYEPRRSMPSLDLSERPEFQLQGDGNRCSSVYDALMGTGEGSA